ncbi:stability determinant [Candidatus Symbiopectobacterium sp. NZEC151]|uniref:type II toxin-antitoxin system RelB family antitoxin n=1 Tax=Candidatus Symbiopectobacterium sp. NZEC151 TaxID=2820470 RepID=UPI0022271FE7|nr:stability determinant [Candidatus Symbiopectobacterium sp. NZEC151]MCW2476887.1 stability determinant [Candidatus Symbiopectobacterium sp. NZEC151]
MVTKLSPIVSEFETQEQADSYDSWFRTKVQAALDDPRPGIPHDEAMATLDKLLEEKRALRGKRAMG